MASMKHIKTLQGLTEEEKIEVSRQDVKHYFKLILWGRSRICAWPPCRKRIDRFEDATLDHKVPRSLGGRTRLFNLQLMHSKCNGEKGSQIHGWNGDMRVFEPMARALHQQAKIMQP